MMTKLKRIEFTKPLKLTALLFTLITIPLAHAEVSVKDYQKFKDSKNIKTHIYGVGVGYAWANTILEMRKENMLYCQPSSLAMDQESYAEIIEREIANNPKFSNSDTEIEIEFILLVGLMKKFPCK